MANDRKVGMGCGSKYRSAIGLEYLSGGQNLPQILAVGEYLRADAIVDIARACGIPVVEEPRLARALSRLRENEEIPEELFEAVALILARVIERRA